MGRSLGDPGQPEELGELRFLAFGPIGDRLHCVTFSVRGENIRIISLRKANSREVERYG